MKDPRTLTTLPEILSALSALQSEEAELSSSLSQLLNDREPIVASLDHLHALLPQLDELEADANVLASRVSNTAKTAQWVGGRVRSLDEEMGRVREAADRVGQVMELKSSLLALQSSIEMKDWEAAARHCARAMALPLDVIAGPYAEAVVPTAESHLPPVQTLQDARETLLKVFRENFTEASRARDSSATSRFFKLFPAIGWEEEGLEAYANFVVELVQVKAPPTAKSSSPLYYITALTALFESIALIVDQHQPVVEKYYGPGKMKSVVKRLLEESDRVTKSLCSGWEEDRSMQRKLSEVTNNPPIPLHSSTSHPRRAPEDLSIDPRGVDKVLSELAGMVGRWNLFKKFILDALTLKEDAEKQETDADQNGDESSPPPVRISPADKEMLDNTASQKLFDQLISTYYIPMEVWYTRTIMDKAHRLSSPNLSQTPVTTTTPDDVFYILKAVLSRLITTGSPAAIEKTALQLKEAIDRDYVGVIKHKLDEVYKTQPPSSMGMGMGVGVGMGGGAHGRPDRVERENRTSFIILLNDLDLSMSHLEQLIRELVDNPLIITYFIEQDQPLVKTHLSSLSSLTSRIKSALRSGIEQLFNQLLRPKLRTFIPDIYKDISYVLDEDGYAAADLQDLTRKRFIKAWDALIDGYKDTFSEANYRLFIGLVLDVLLRPWEKYVMGLKYTELGAVRFDRDLRAIIAYLSSQTTFGDIREKFLRLQQISTLLNLDADEDIDEFYNGSGISWKIGRHEAKAIAALKI